jgi:hypothetical protein
MNLLLKLSTLVFITVASSCDASKKAAEDTTSKETTTTMSQDVIKEMDTTLQNEGYSLATVMYVKDSNCSYIIVDEKTGEKFDPINMDTKEYSLFKKDNESIYIQFRRLRRASRCDNIQVIEISSIKKREG